MAIVHNLMVDRYAPDGSARRQDIAVHQLGGAYGFYGAKWLDHDTHAWIEGTSIGKLFSLGRLNADAEIAGNQASVLHSVAMNYSMQGLAKIMNEDGQQSCMFFDTSTSPDNGYLIRIPTDGSPFEVIAAVGPPSDREQVWGPCHCGRDFANVAKAGTSNNEIDVMRFDGTAFDAVATIFPRTRFTNQRCKGIAFNGRDIAVVSQYSLVIPPTSYRVDVGRIGISSGLVEHTWSRSFGSGELAEVVDIDWNGREWLVYWNYVFDTGA